MPEEKKEISRRVKIARERRHQFVVTLSTLLTSAFGLVAALAWNELVKELINQYIAPGQTLVSKLIYAMVVTLLAVFASLQLGKLTAISEVEKEIEREKKDQK
jgi:predicted outer membrane lipoprotein